MASNTGYLPQKGTAMDNLLGNGKTSSRIGKFLHKIQTAAHDGLPLKLKKPVTQNIMQLL